MFINLLCTPKYQVSSPTLFDCSIPIVIYSLYLSLIFCEYVLISNTGVSLSDSNVTGKEVRKSTGTFDGYGLEKGEEEEEEERGDVIVPVSKMQVDNKSWCASKSGKGKRIIRVIESRTGRGKGRRG